MRFWKTTLLTSVTFLGLVFTVLYSSCVKDSCEDLSCKNGGSCSNGQCHCPSGYEGTECETQSAYKFVGQYYGYTNCDGYPNLVDTMDIFIISRPVTMGMVRHGAAGDTIKGTVKGSQIIVDDVVNGNTALYTNLVLDNKKIVFVRETITSISDGKKYVCKFDGNKP